MINDRWCLFLLASDIFLPHLWLFSSPLITPNPFENTDKCPYWLFSLNMSNFRTFSACSTILNFNLLLFLPDVAEHVLWGHLAEYGRLHAGYIMRIEKLETQYTWGSFICLLNCRASRKGTSKNLKRLYFLLIVVS